MSPQKTFFITGTDTDVGKTLCCKALLQAAAKQKHTTAAYKPISAGCQLTQSGLRNNDALILQENSTITLAYEAVNPIAFQLPIAPHIAAQLENRVIDFDLISQGLQYLQQKKTDLIFVEGAGGWRLPIDDKRMLSDWVVAQKLPVILVVGMKLGGLNHALLTYETIINDGLNVAGWIANQLQADMPYYQQNLQWLKMKITVPLIAEIPYLNHPQHCDLSPFIDIDLAKLS